MAKFDYESLPKKRMAAGCLFFNDDKAILLVKPGYKPGWEIPGGIVELNESPRQACQREVKEELGLNRTIERLLLIDYNSPTDIKTESLMFVFYGGLLSTDDIAQINLPRDELLAYRFFEQQALPPDMNATLRTRVLRAWQQIDQSGTIYVEN